MTKRIFLNLILISNFSWATSKPLTLQKLEEDKDFAAGCGCSLQNKKNDFLAFAAIEEKASIRIKIDGQKKDLKWASSTETDKEPKKGDKFNRVYSDGKCKLTLNYKVTCGSDCESTQYSVDATVEDGAEKNTLKSLTGSCGC